MKKKVVLDVGHGGKDPGACANGLVEKNLNLKVGLAAREHLAQNYDVEVLMTRNSDIDLGNETRVELINKYNPDLCVSIHHNAAASLDARGAETIHAHKDTRDDALAKLILTKLAAAGMPTRRAFTKTYENGSDWYFMIRRIWDNDTQAVIVEGGFVTNSMDAALLKTEEYLEAEGKAIAEAVAEHLQLKPIKTAQVKVQTEHWGKPFIKELKDMGLITQEHDPDANVTWAQFATVISRLVNQA